MIILFHTFYIMTKYILRVISKSIFNKAEDTSCEQETNTNVILSGNNTVTSRAEFTPGVGIRFFPPVCVQRYVAVKNILQDERWNGEIRKVVDFGCAEFGFFPYMKHIPGVQEVVAVDTDHEMLDRYCCRAAPLNSDYLDNRQERLTVHVLAGSVADWDPRLLGTDAVICIELIEHLYPDTLEAVPQTVFGFIKPLLAVFTTPNSDFNVLFPNFAGLRHSDHKFEWSRVQFEDWATNITTRYPAYTVEFHGIGQGPKGTEEHGCCSQMAVFVKLPYDTSAPVIQLTSQHEDMEVEECEESYVTVREYIYPFHVVEKNVLRVAEYYIRLLASDEKYCNDMSIQIPLRLLLPHVEMWCNSTSLLRNILEEAGWEVVGQTQDEEAVLYPYYGECESSVHELEDWYYEQKDREVSLQVADSLEENWWYMSQTHHGEMSQLVKDTGSVQLEDWSCDSTEPQNEVHLQRNGDSSDVGHLSIKKDVEQMITSTSQNLNIFSTNLNSKDDIDIRSLADFEPELSTEQTFVPYVGHDANKEGFGCSEIGQNCTPLGAVNIESSQKLDFEKCSNDEGLVHKSETHKKKGETLSLCFSFEDSKTIGEHNNCHCLKHQVTASQLKSLSVNLSNDCVLLNSSSNKNNEKHSNVCHSIHTEESLSVELLNFNIMREIADGCTSQVVMSQPLNFGSASSSSLQEDRSLIESCSLDKAGDSGYPNSFSIQDMDMDLTPEQVDELSTESDEISEDSEYYESESSERSDRIDNNDGLLFQFHHEALYDPVGLVVENGDVANNNRDGEGNNAVAVMHPLLEQGEVANAADDFIPLLAAAEDFDNDNALILPDDIQPFPHWLLHLLNLANHGGGDLQNYMIGGGDFIMPDEGVGDIVNENDDSDNSEVGDSEGSLDDELVPIDIGGGGEPDTFRDGI